MEAAKTEAKRDLLANKPQNLEEVDAWLAKYMAAVDAERAEALRTERLNDAAPKLLKAAQDFITHLERVGIPNDDEPFVDALIAAVSEATGSAA